MHPQVQLTEPGLCPLCPMDLIPLVTSGGDDVPRQLKMSNAAMKLAEIQTVPARREYIEHELRLVGKVEYDETRLKYITAWYPGRLDRLFVDYTGTPVKQGDHLAEIYSPSIRTDQESLLQALQAANTAEDTPISQVQVNRQEMLERTRERLRLLGVTDQQIHEIENRGTPSDRITFYSPIDGIVIHKNALQGDYVQTGNRIYTIADLTQVWVKMDAYESDLPWIHYGQEIEFTTVSYPGEVFQGRISFIDPFLNEQTRTIKVRVNVPNPYGKLKPDMFVRAIVRSKVNSKGEFSDPELAGKWISPMHPEIIKDEPGVCDVCGMPLVKAETLGFVNIEKSDSQPPLIIPGSAPLITGTRAVVYVKIPNTDKPTFEGREIVLGPRLKGHYVVHAGLEEGEEVVVKGNFKIDSALQIKAEPSMMSPEGEGAAGAHAHSGTMKEDTAKKDRQEKVLPQMAMIALLPVYQAIMRSLVTDDLGQAQKDSQDWVDRSKTHQLKDVEMLGHKVMHAANIEEARQAFESISELLITSFEKQGSPKDTVFMAFCPMAFNNKGARWIQWGEDIENPYFGSAMLTCGEIKTTFSPTKNH